MRRLIIAIIFFLVTISVLGKDYSGKNLLFLGTSVESLGKGGTGVTNDGVDLLFINPASISYLERTAASMQYGNIVSDYYNPEGAIAIPSSYANFGLGLKYINIEDGLDITSGYYGTFAAAKPFSDNLEGGLSLNILYGSEEEGGLLYIGAGIGFIFKVPYVKTLGSGFGLFSPKIAFSINAGLPLDEKTGTANMNSVILGYSFDFYKNKNFILSFENEVTALNYYKGFPVKFGIEALIKDHFVVRTGFVVPDDLEFGTFTSGVGYIHDFSKGNVEINYSLVHHKDSNFVHYAGVKFEIGELDRTPPETAIKTDYKYISPNYDGNNDYVNIDLEVRDRSRIKGWTLQIHNSKGELVREYKVSEREVNKSLTPTEFIKKIFSRKESMVVPEKVLWDGADSNGNVVPDGEYTYSFAAWDERNNYSLKKEGTVYVDNSSPEIDIKAESLLFSPNGDKSKDVLKITQEVKSEEGDVWEAAFVDSNGKIVKKYTWKHGEVPSEITWDGTDSSGKEAPEGLYTYYVTCTDKANNSDRKVIKEITLTRQYQTIDIKSGSEYISADLNSNLSFNIELSDGTGLQYWIAVIYDKEGEPVRTVKGEKNLPDTINWNFKNDDGKYVGDGEYFYKITAYFDSGNKPASFKKKIIVDSTKPDVEFDFSPGLFSPDDDGENDILNIEVKAKDDYGINEWVIIITNPTGFEFKRFSGTGTPPDLIKWDGIGDNKELVESATDYRVKYIVTDNSGNTSVKDNIKLPIDVLVVVTDRGLKIKISNIEFAFGSAKIIGNGKRILNRVAQILKKYDKYDIVIEGHTDDIGKEDYNLKLSEARARAVYEYLISRGIKKERLKFRGMGETMPYIQNVDNESRRKNRRVEFILIKPDEGDNSDEK